MTYIEGMDVSYNKDKFVELLLLVASRLREDRAGGATKLNKVLFFAEFTQLRRHGRVISGCEFQKLAHGPAPRQLLPVRQQLIQSGDAHLVAEDLLGRPQQRLIPNREPNLELFDDSELDTVNDVLTQLSGMTAMQVSNLSHQEPGWRFTELYETIPFATAFLGYPQIKTPTSERLANSAKARRRVPANR